MKKLVLILIVSLLVIAGKVEGQCIITGPDASTTLCVGGSVILTVSSSGTAPFTYIWEYSANGTSGWAAVEDDTPSGITYSGGNTSSLTVTGDGSEGTDSKHYRCSVQATDCGPTYSSIAVVTTVADISITSQPTSPAAICEGGNSASMSITASGGTPSLTYTWQYDNGGTWENVANGTPAGSSYTGSDGTDFSVAGLSTVGTYDYRCIVAATGDGCGSETSSTVTVTVVADPNITTQPTSPAAICTGGTTANMIIAASGGTPSLSYQWQYFNGSTWGNVVNGTPAGSTYTGSSSTSFSVAGISTGGTYDYRCIVSATGDGCASVTSSTVTITVVSDPNITTQPISPASVCAGGTTANMIIAASGGTPSLSYTWQYDNGGTWGNVVDGIPAGSVYSGSTGTSFSVTGISAGGTYDYRCRVSATGDGCASATSSTVTVTIDPISVGGIIASDQTICYLTSPADLVLSGNVGSVLKWQRSADAGFTSPTDIAGTSTTLTGTTIGILTSDTYFRAVVKSGTCTETVSSSVLITVRSIPTASISVTPSSVCQNGTSPVITFTNPNTSAVTITYNINGSGQTTIDVAASTTATLNVPTANVGTLVYILENVFYQDLPPCSNVISGTATVTVNPLPVPVITGPVTPRVTSTGNTYSTTSGMTNYTWGGFGTPGTDYVISSGGIGTTNYTVTLNWLTPGLKPLTLIYTNANGCTAASATGYNVDVKPLPAASAVAITGTPEVGKLLAGSYTYTDGAGYDEGTSTFKWYRDVTTAISGATSLTYTPTSDDDGHTITFEVTPKSSSPVPNTGIAVKSSATSAVVSSGVPVASEVCIERVGTTLTGKYKYTFAPKAEGTSTYRWLRDGSTVVGTNLTYELQAADTADGVLITFEVTPKSLPSVKTGIPVESYPLARFTMSELSYSESVSEVTLTADPTGGVFSGPGVTNGKFAPNSVGTSGSPYTMIYSVNIVNPNVTCSQKAYECITVTPGTTSFGVVEDPICHNDDAFWVTVETIPTGAEPYMYYADYGSWGYDFSFYMNDYYWSTTNTTNRGIVEEDLSNTPYNPLGNPWKVKIDPTLLNPGNGNNILYLYYIFEGYYYQISKPLNIEAVETVTRINNYNPAYCADAPIQDLSVDILYPSGAHAIWTGAPILSDLDQPVAKLNPASGTPGQTYTISYQYSSPNGCLSNIIDEDVTINPLPDASFTLNATYNIDSGAVTLIPVLPPGGTFIGNGVSANKLFPDIAGTGTNFITYTIRDANFCYNESNKSTIIRKAQGTIVGLTPVICYKDTTYTVSVTGLPSTATILDFTNSKNSIVHTHGASTASYSVVAAGSGLDTLYLSYLYETVDYAVSAVVNVDSIGLVEIKNLLPGDIVCANIPPFELFTSPSGGSFSGPVTGGYLDPSKAMGLTSVRYLYTNIKTGCSASTVVPFNISPAASVSFVPADFCIDDSGTDTTFFVNNTVSSDSVASWLWEFVDPAGSTTSYDENPGNLYDKGGFHTVTLTATTINNCISSKTSTFDLGEKPLADFYWRNECFSTNDSIMLYDTTYSLSRILSQTWDFFDGGPLHTTKDTKYPKKSTGYLNVRYIVNTSYANCSDTVNKNIYIRPTIALTEDGYFENFENGDGDWVQADEAINSWSFGTPDRSTINFAASGENAWFTSFDLANQVVESSSIISPCFDFTLAERPMISIKLWRHFYTNSDGAALQYRIDDVNEWEYVGSYDDGINWYNSSLIKGRPGGEQLGWTTIGTPETEWIEARHSLDELKGKKDIKFRIAYGSNGQGIGNDGVAFDDIFIGERTRNVLLEHFANASYLASSEATTMINDITADNDIDIINVQYHTNFPGIDSLYLENPADVSARISFYGLTKAPYSFVDGGTNKAYANIFPYSSKEDDGSLVRINPNDVTRRSLISPAFEINIEPTNVSDGILTVSGQLTALQDLDVSNLTLYIAVVEKRVDSVYTGAAGEKSFLNVFRKFIPDAGGINLKKTWTKGETIAVEEESWVIQGVLDNSDIEVVAFIQNSVTKEMYQASSVLKPDIVVGIEKPLATGQVDFALYPNPAKHQLTIRFGEILESDTDIFIYDFNGAIVRTFKTGSGETEFIIDDLGLRDGIYLIRISSGGLNFGFKKLIIAGS